MEATAPDTQIPVWGRDLPPFLRVLVTALYNLDFLVARRVRLRAWDGARELGCGDRAAAYALSQAGYWYWRDCPRHQAVAFGVRDGLVEMRKREIAAGMAAEGVAA